MKQTVILFTVLLTGCAEMPKPSYAGSSNGSPSQNEAKYEACIKQQAEILDDGISPADVIGRSIADACNKHYIASSMDIVSNENQAVQNTFYNQITNDRDLAAAGPTNYVLSRRSYLKRHGK